MKVERFLSEIMKADLIRDVWELHVSKMREYNFDRLVYGFTHFLRITDWAIPMILRFLPTTVQII